MMLINIISTLFYKIFTQYLFILYLTKTYTSLALLNKVYTFYTIKNQKATYQKPAAENNYGGLLYKQRILLEKPIPN